MDDVLILSRALSEDDVASLAANGAAEFLGLSNIRGDFDGNGLLDINDINALTSASAAGTNDSSFDLNEDSLVNDEDVLVWAKDLKSTWLGDANLDGEFNSSDLVAVFAASKFEKGVDASWQEGDWNGDGRFGTGDLVAAFSDGGYEKGERNLQVVPEPSAACLCWGPLWLAAFLRWKQFA